MPNFAETKKKMKTFYKLALDERYFYAENLPKVLEFDEPFIVCIQK